MNAQEANDYIQAALIGTIKLTGLESTILRNLTELNQETAKLAQNIQQATAHLEQAKVQLLTLNGRREGYAQILVDEEAVRRKKVDLAPQGKEVALSAEDRDILSAALSEQISKAEIFPVRPSRPTVQP